MEGNLSLSVRFGQLQHELKESGFEEKYEPMQQKQRNCVMSGRGDVQKMNRFFVDRS